MADMLKFRKGTYAQINAAPKAAGTIYIARDEKAMYVDVDADTRIRIGDFIRVDTVKDITPPYSTSSLYYVENDNALLKYDGSHWKQVNGTDDLTDRLTTAENAIDAVEGLVGTKTDAADATGSAFGRIAKNKADISTLNTYVGTIPEGATSTNVVDYIKEKTTGIATSANLEALTTRVTTAEGEITTLKNSSSDHANRIANLEKKDVALKSDVAAAKTYILGQAEGGADFVGTVKGAYEKADAAKAQADKGVTDAATAQTQANTNKEAISGLTSRVTALDKAGTGRVAILEGKVNTLENAGYATVGDVNTAKSEVIGTEADDAGATTVHGALKSAAAADAKAVAATNAASAAQGDIDAWEEAHKNDYKNTKIDELVADAKQAGTDAQTALNTYKDAHAGDYTNDQIDTKISTVSGSAAAAKAAADAAQKDATKALADAKAANDNANTRVLTTDFNTFKTNNTAAIADAKKAGTDAGDQAETNRQAIATLQGTVNKLDGDVNTDGSVKKQIKDATDTLETKLSNKIEADIRSANAMEYAGTINSASDIPTTGVKNGATYVIGTSFGSYAAGDMLIAQGTEVPETGLITTPTWAHVKSGYDASLDQQLTGANNKIMLSNGVRNDEDAAGAITFAATGSASVAVADNTVTIGMVWEDFGN